LQLDVIQLYDNFDDKLQHLKEQNQRNQQQQQLSKSKPKSSNGVSLVMKKRSRKDQEQSEIDAIASIATSILPHFPYSNNRLSNQNNMVKYRSIEQNK
jgi:hypothetical protein